MAFASDLVFEGSNPPQVMPDKFVSISTYRVVQLDLTPEIEGICMLFERCHSKNISLKQHIIQYYNFRFNIKLDYPGPNVDDPLIAKYKAQDQAFVTASLTQKD